MVQKSKMGRGGKRQKREEKKVQRRGDKCGKMLTFGNLCEEHPEFFVLFCNISVSEIMSK